LPTPILLIELHLNNGQIERFELDDAEHARMLAEQLLPTKVFTGPPLSLSEPHCLSTYRTQQIVRIDVSGSAAPHWPYLSNASSIVEVSEAEFERLCGSDDLARERLAAWQKPGTTQVGFTEIILTTGQRVIWQVTMESAEMVAVDSLSVAKHLLNAGALHGKRFDGATMIINMAHVARLSFYPGPPQTHARTAAVRRV
jgi:hypothetical protein